MTRFPQGFFVCNGAGEASALKLPEVLLHSGRTHADALPTRAQLRSTIPP